MRFGRIAGDPRRSAPLFRKALSRCITFGLLGVALLGNAHPPAIARQSASDPRIADLVVDNGPPNVPNVLGRKRVALPLYLFNNGPDTARRLIVTIEVPAGMAFREFYAPSGWRVNAPRRGDAGTVVCRSSRLKAGRSEVFLLIVDAEASTPAGDVTSRREVMSDTLDPNEANNATDFSGYLIGPRPTISDIQVVTRPDGQSELVITGEGFTSDVAVIAAGSTFVEPAEVDPEGRTIRQGGVTFTTGRTIDELLPHGKRTYIAVENSDLGYREVRYRRP